MIDEKGFDCFLKTGSLKGLEPQAPLNKLIALYGDDYWTVQEKESNGLIYGIIMVGMVEHHIYDEKLTGISIRPYAFDDNDYQTITPPWIATKLKLKDILTELTNRGIGYKKYNAIGPLPKFNTSGARSFDLSEGEHTFIDTEGGVTFLFDSNSESPEIEMYQICKYYES